MLLPRAKKENYFDEKYILKAYDESIDLMYLYKKYKHGNEDVTIITDSALGKEEYKLTINSAGITITASCDNGIFRAVSSLRQLLFDYKDALPCCEIEDSPVFEKRSYMLDISRCRMPKVSTITRLIDLLADLKYNEFQLYMESFVYKCKAYPKYTEDFDCLTPEDIEYLVDYCEERFIDLVPNQNSLGHMGTWLDEEEFKPLALTDGSHRSTTINPLLPETFEFMDNLYDSLLPHFKSEYVNIGLDEAYELDKFQLEEVCKEKGVENVFMDWLGKLSDHIGKKYGKKVQFWADMVYKYPESYSRVPKDAVALNWGYDRDITAQMEKRCIDLASMGTSFYICPGNQTWITFTGKHDLCAFNLYTCGKLGEKYGAKGYMLTDWGCGEGHTHFPVWSLIPAVMAGQISWNGANEDPRHYTRYAEKYLDDYVFNAKISSRIRMLQQYYLLEPERVPSTTMCGYTIRYPLTETKAFCFDLKVSGEPIFFENVIWYVKRCLEDVVKTDFDENWKRQIIINSKMVILSAELCIIRMSQTCDSKKIDELVELIDFIAEEYTILWDRENYSKGKEHFLEQLEGRRKELLEMKN
ncbi:MAG: family 20 glycosylhydrolase [Clostridia bacterium]|nr:family 20 glycosylhydrolase [Clostridia bacterium]